MSSGGHGGSHASGPLPEELTVPGWRVALIIASFTFSLPGFLNGAQTGLALGLHRAVLVALLGGLILCAGACLTAIISVRTRRSEEHTSELQSLMRISYAVFCLKKKK